MRGRVMNNVPSTNYRPLWRMHFRTVLTALCLVFVATEPLRASPCVDDGLAAYRHSGAEASYPVFRQRLEDPACVRSIILLLNYARVIEEIVDARGDDPKTCEAVEVYTQVSNHPRAAAPIRKLGQRGVAKLSERCVSYVEKQTPEDYYRILSRADSLRGASRLRAAALDYKTAYRLRPKRREAPLALCEILPRINRNSEAEAFCRPTENSLPSVESASAGDNIVEAEVSPAQTSTAAWVLGSSAALALATGGIFHGLAHSRADDAWSARKAGLSAQDRDDNGQIEGAINRINSANDEAKSFEIAAWSLYGLGAILGGLSLYKFFSGSTSQPNGLTIGPSSIGYSVQW